MPRLDDGIETRCVIVTGDRRDVLGRLRHRRHPRRSFEHDAEALVAHPFTRRWRRSAATRFRSSPRSTATASAAGSSWRCAATCGSAPTAAKLGMPPAQLGLIYGHTGLRALHRRDRRRRGPRSCSSPGATSTPSAPSASGSSTRSSPTAESRPPRSSSPPRSPPTRRSRCAATSARSRPWPRSARLTPEQERELVELRESCFRSEDFREGIRAFAEKREPRWQGR